MITIPLRRKMGPAIKPPPGASKRMADALDETVARLAGSQDM